MHYNITQLGENGAKFHQNVLKWGMNNMQLVGEYYHTLDAKNRLFIPSKQREVLGENFLITRKVGDKCLAVYSAEEWEKFSQKLTQFPDSVVNKLKRFLYSKTITATPDAQGRIMLTPALIEYAGIEKNVAIIGCGDHAQIWAEGAWKDDEQNLDTAEMQALLIELGL